MRRSSCSPERPRCNWEPSTTSGLRQPGRPAVASLGICMNMGSRSVARCRSGLPVCWRMPERNDGQHDAHRAFEAAGAFLRGHFVYTSGRHGADYLEKFRILEDPKATTELAGMIAERFTPLRTELVAGPTTGGIILAYEVARQLGINAVYVERG